MRIRCLNIKTIILIFIVLTIAGCYTYNTTVTNKNVAFLYNPHSSGLHPAYQIYHQEDTLSQLFFSVPVSEMLFSRISDSEMPTARLKIKYRLFAYEGNNQMTDSASMIFHIVKNDTQEFFTNFLFFMARSPEKYTLEVVATDLTKQTTNTRYLEVNKTNYYVRQNFMVTDKDEHPLFRNYFDSSSAVYIRHRNPGINQLFVLYFNDEFPLPAPPFSIKAAKPVNMSPDSIWTLRFRDTAGLMLKKRGLYHIQTDTANNMGLTLLNFGSNHPYFNTPVKLLEPIRYLTQRKEYSQLEMYAEKKNAVDNFWMECAGNVNRAKELIRVFYNRATYANIYFSSHTEGWQTDRGMVYIIYGQPNTIYKTNVSEQWIYGDEVAIASMNFVFNKMENPFSDNNYVLFRTEDLAKSWYQAVETWRNGRVFSVSK
ncbi:MAG: GWxTD domain-containing protein [Bacteroidetes bacterium]|nr:GWxTD domain-containing protein [Bacteroidota bacterium]